MPTLAEMKCKECDEVKTKDELASNDGYCDDCAVGRCIICREQLPQEELDKEEPALMCSECEKVGLGADSSEPANEDELTPEMLKAKRAYEKHQEYMREYNSKPHVKAKRKQYQKDRNKRNAQVIKRLKEMGVIVPKKNGDG